MGVFTIGIAEEDRPRRWRAHRHCTNGRAVSPITCWVALAPKAEWAGGAPAPLEQWHYSTRGSARSVQWSPGSAKTSLPCTRRTRQVLHRAWRAGAPLAETLPCEKRTHMLAASGSECRGQPGEKAQLRQWCGPTREKKQKGSLLLQLFVLIRLAVYLVF